MTTLVREPSLDGYSSPSDSGKENVSRSTPTTGKAQHKQKVFTGNPYSLEDVETLDEFVLMDHLPELLIVHDRNNITNLCPNQTGYERVLYKRVHPELVDSRKRLQDMRTGVLYLDSTNFVASGRRSTVHRAPLTATLGPRGDQRRRVAVAVKTANDSCRSHQLLRQEAEGYATFPREFFTDSKVIPVDAFPKTYPSAMLHSGTFPGWGVVMAPKSSEPVELAPPIAPKFYGFYVPINSKGKSITRKHTSCEDFANSNCPVPHWPKAILLMEDCGIPIEATTMPVQQKEQCFELVERMHRQGFSHGCAHPRNMLVQPGPLSAPVNLRSMDMPSFRLVSFGRWRGFNRALHLETSWGAKKAFEKGRECDVITAMHELRLVNSPLMDE